LGQLVVQAYDNHRRTARSVDDLTSWMPVPEEASALKLALGVPVIRVLCTV
jgi:hypothetical protein